jgi:hypothetical protein
VECIASSSARQKMDINYGMTCRADVCESKPIEVSEAPDSGACPLEGLLTASS